MPMFDDGWAPKGAFFLRGVSMMMNQGSEGTAAEIGGGALLMTTHFWLPALEAWNHAAATVATSCGAVLGVAGVIRLVRQFRGSAR